MKRIIIISILLLLPMLLVGCESSQMKEAKEKCKEALKEVYQNANDDTITTCIADISKEKMEVSYKFCKNTNNDIYTIAGKYSKGDTLYDMYIDYYDQLKSKEVDNKDEDYYAFEFEASELK